jgi:REP element-mobilizing transposase RayT
MSRSYKFHNPEGIYFVSFAVVYWIDVFTRPVYKNIIVNSLKYSQSEKGMEIFAWCIMTNHIHLVFRSCNGIKPEQLIGDLKRYTSKKIVESIIENPQESRKEWLLNAFVKAAQNSSNVKNKQFWRHDNKPIELWANKVIDEKIDYIHNNPVVEGIVNEPYEYVYSSSKNYCGESGILAVTVLK